MGKETWLDPIYAKPHTKLYARQTVVAAKQEAEPRLTAGAHYYCVCKEWARAHRQTHNRQRKDPQPTKKSVVFLLYVRK